MKQNAVITNEAQLGKFLKYWEACKLPEDGYYVEWEPKADRRTSDQNALLWVGAYRPIAEYLSEQSGKIITSEHVHAVAKDRFLDPVIVELNGKSKSYPGSTTKLKKKEFGDYLEQVWAWGGSMGVWFA
ncbi:MAG: recombination protein NinB [Bacteroidales bacterium]|nr:recombination protein NinB [Candidatus Latescibacterota bacterium]